MMGSIEKNVSLSTHQVTLGHLQHAAKLIDQHILKDEMYPELWDLLNTSSGGEYSADNMRQFVKKGTILIPDVLFEQYDMLECKCFMGLFSEINRAWLTIDNRLFLWNYEDGSDFVVYDELDQIIVSVALVSPKTGVFIEEITHVLVIATPIEILLLGVFFDLSKKPSGTEDIRRKLSTAELILYPTQLSVPSDYVSMLSMVGTEQGRIFMCGKDGNIYELAYQAYEGWFTKRCHKINHTQSTMSLLIPSFLKFTTENPIIQLAYDKSRNLLFSLSENSVLQAFYLGKSGTDMMRLGSVSSLGYHAQRLCPRSHLLDPKNIKVISIHTIDEIESKYLHLVAVTSNGIRLYFSTIPHLIRTMGRINIERVSPSGFELVHVRLPPAPRMLPGEGQRLVTHNILNHVHSTYYSHGAFLLANAISDDIDNLVCIHPDAGEIFKSRKHYFDETASEFNIDGRTWAIAELIDTIEPYTQYHFRLALLNELLVQHMLPPRTFLLLTNTGLHIIQKLRPVDQLYQLLVESRGQETEGLRQFFESFTKDQACTMCLILACGIFTAETAGSKLDHTQSMKALISPVRSQRYAEDMSAWAAWVYFRLGGEPRLAEKSMAAADAMGEIGRPISAPDVIYSGTHNGLYIHVARLLRPIWKTPIANKGLVDDTQLVQFLPSGSLRHITEQLYSTKKFLDTNPFLFSPKRPSERIEMPPLESKEKSVLEEAALLEQQSFYSIYQLILQTLEGLAFIQLLHDYSFSSLFSGLGENYRSELFSTTLEDLITTSKGREFARETLSILVNKYIKNGVNIDAMTDLLRERCPTFFGAEDVLFHKGSELIQRAQSSYFPQERDELLKESLQLLLKVAGRIPSNKLHTICRTYKAAGFFMGALELSLIRAKEGDPSGIAVAYYNDGSPAGDSREIVYKDRLECYFCIFQLIEDLNEEIRTMKTGIQRSHDGDKYIPLSIGDVEKTKSVIFQKITMSEDELFHFILYSWLLDKRAFDDLLEIQSPYLEMYLTQRVRETVNEEEIDLLWRFYVKNKRFSQASTELLRLAELERYLILPEITIHI
jgi:nuclear pore complex protein Nup155